MSNIGVDIVVFPSPHILLRKYTTMQSGQTFVCSVTKQKSSTPPWDG